ncbi:amino acid adenylation domain-containing protein, partial [Amycolatopsis magusensis]|uniref:amino acid adenylation domain-containing protein n=1 Tax=Amycolatopsis magusensis TaxID=882444 RepID=UPI0024A90D18
GRRRHRFAIPPAARGPDPARAAPSPRLSCPARPRGRPCGVVDPAADLLLTAADLERSPEPSAPSAGAVGARAGDLAVEPALTHRRLADRARWAARRQGLTGHDRVLHTTTDGAHWELFAPLSVGAAVVFPGAQGIVRAITEHGVTVLHARAKDLPPLLADPEWARCHSLRLLYSEGEPLSIDLLNLARGHGSGAPSVLDLFERRAGETPDAIAVDCAGVTTSYRELDALANGIGLRLREAGVSAGDAVGVLADRGPLLSAAMLGAWKAGAAYVPIDPSYPAERIAHMLADANAAVAVTTSRYASRFTTHTVLAGDAGTSTTAPVRDRDLAAPAYVIYTSGSTGRPKGVRVNHHGLVNHISWAAASLAARGGGGAPVFSSVAFDLVQPNLWAPLVCGQRVWFLPQDTPLDQLGPVLADAAPFSFVKLTPSHLDVLAATLTPARAARIAPVLVVAGEPLSARTVRAWRALAPDTQLINEYGPTEATVGSTIWPVPEEPAAEVLPIGAPLPAMTSYVLDDRMRPVPVGVAGELFVGGLGVADGYAGSAELTAQRFVPDPFSARTGTRLYRTGDLARWTGDGVLEFLGRQDDQVKIRGHRVEPGEVAAVLAEHPDVADAAVLAVPGDHGFYLVGYVVPATSASQPKGWLTTYCATRLPDYLVPADVVELDALPLNANGKLDRARLPVPDRTTAEFEEPETPTEAVLAGIWARVLDLDRVGRQDGFFALGGHSILLIRVIAETNAAGLAVSLFTFFENDTLAAVAAAIDATAPSAPTAPTVPTVAPGGHDLTRLVSEALEEFPVPGVCLGIIDGGEIVEVRGFGSAGADTLFTVGSISKCVTALGVLRLVDEGVLDLDTDVNEYLREWSVPATPGLPPVTPRLLLSHRTGLTSELPQGYRPGEPMPTVADLLHGRPPAEGEPIRRERVLGGGVYYSGTNYLVLQQLVEDVTGKPLAESVRELVLAPLRLENSGFERDLPQRTALPVARGHDREGVPLDCGWLDRPDAGSAGFWTTGTDLATLVGEIRRGYLGRPGALLSRPLATEMLTAPERSSFGLGVVTEQVGGDLQFGHGGSPVGYYAGIACRVRQGTGLALLADSDLGKQLFYRVMARMNWDFPYDAPRDELAAR